MALLHAAVWRLQPRGHNSTGLGMSFVEMPKVIVAIVVMAGRVAAAKDLGAGARAPLDQSECRFMTHSNSSKLDESVWAFALTQKRTLVGWCWCQGESEGWRRPVERQVVGRRAVWDAQVVVTAGETQQWEIRRRYGSAPIRNPATTPVQPTEPHHSRRRLHVTTSPGIAPVCNPRLLQSRNRTYLSPVCIYHPLLFALRVLYLLRGVAEQHVCGAPAKL